MAVQASNERERAGLSVKHSKSIDNLRLLISYPDDIRLVRRVTGLEIKQKIQEALEPDTVYWDGYINKADVEQFKKSYMDNEYPISDSKEYYLCWGGPRQCALLCRRAPDTDKSIK